MPWQVHREGGARVRGGLDRDRTAVRGRQLLYDVEPEAQATLSAACAMAEWLEEMWQERRLNGLSIVMHRQDHFVGAACAAHAHEPVGRAVLQGVGNEVGHELRQTTLVPHALSRSV